MHHDQAPLQVTEFAQVRVRNPPSPVFMPDCSNLLQGAAIDAEIKKIYIEGNGGAATEDYEFCVYYYNKMSRFENNTGKPFFFITGDEQFYEKVDASAIEKLIHPEAAGDQHLMHALQLTL